MHRMLGPIERHMLYLANVINTVISTYYMPPSLKFGFAIFVTTDNVIEPLSYSSYQMLRRLSSGVFSKSLYQWYLICNVLSLVSAAVSKYAQPVHKSNPLDHPLYTWLVMWPLPHSQTVYTFCITLWKLCSWPLHNIIRVVWWGTWHHWHAAKYGIWNFGTLWFLM